MCKSAVYRTPSPLATVSRDPLCAGVGRPCATPSPLCDAPTARAVPTPHPRRRRDPWLSVLPLRLMQAPRRAVGTLNRIHIWYFTILPRNGDAGLGGGLLADIDMRWSVQRWSVQQMTGGRRGSHDASNTRRRRRELVRAVRRRAVERDVVHGPCPDLDLEAR